MKRLIKKMKKGFTIVELVVVIAVIAIIAAVSIPTFTNIIRKSQVSADVQLCRNLNTVLANARAENRIPSSVYDVLYLENEAGYVIANLNPTADGYYYAWDKVNNKMIYLQEDLETVYYPEDYTVNPSDCWITVASASEAATVAAKGYNLALENDISDTITLDTVVSIDTLGYKATNVVFSGTSQESVTETAYMIGEFGSISGDIGGTSIVQTGSASSVSVNGTSSASVTISGSVASYSATGVSSSTVSGTGMVTKVSSNNASSITNNGVVQSCESSSTTITGKGQNSVDNNTVQASSKEDLDSIRTQVASGARSFAGETVKLSSNINLNGIAFTPIANVSREGSDSASRFKGTFDGNNCTISNFSTTGFSITGLNAGRNDSTPCFTRSKIIYNEAVYGLFGVVEDATIKNLTVSCNIDMVLDFSRSYVGDSVGGIVGCAFGKVTFENCVVTGTIKGYDGVGGLLGRLKGSSATFINCRNEAEVTGVRKTGGFIGSSYSGEYTVTYTNCLNKGNITCLGVEKDVELECWAKGSSGSYSIYMPDHLDTYNVSKQNYNGYYTASASNGEYASHQYIASTAENRKHKNNVINNGFTNTGVIKVGEVSVNQGTYMNGCSGKMSYVVNN